MRACRKGQQPHCKSTRTPVQAIGVCQVRCRAIGSGEGLYRRSDNPPKGLFPSVHWRHTCRIKKIIGKPYAGKPRVRFERGFMETG